MRWRRVLSLSLAWLVGCLIALATFPSLRRMLSPWSRIDADKIVMLASDHCPTSRKALRLVEPGNDLADLVVPVPADGRDVDQPLTCEAALRAIGKDHPHVNWLPARVACRWLAEDVHEALAGRAVPTPSWFFDGQVITYEDAAREAELFRSFGWDIAWTSFGLRVTPVGQESDAGAPMREGHVKRLEDLQVDPFRPDQ